METPCGFTAATAAVQALAGAAGNSSCIGSGANAARVEVENNSLSSMMCAETPWACSKNPIFEGGRGPGGGGTAIAAGGGVAICEAVSNDKDKPNVGANLSDEYKAELGGAGSGTPGGHGPEDEENARAREQQQNRFNELSDIFDKSNPSKDLTIDGQTIRQGEASNNYGTTKVYESQKS